MNKPTLCFAKLALLGPTMMKSDTYKKAKSMGWTDEITLEDAGHIYVALCPDNIKVPEIEPRDIDKAQAKKKLTGDRITSEPLGASFIFNGSFWVET